MAKVKLNDVDSKELIEFFKKADIKSSQTMEIVDGKLTSRAYPKSKAFIKTEKLDLTKYLNKEDVKARLKLPMLSLDKMVSSLSLFKEKVNIEFTVANSIIEKTALSYDGTAFTVISGDLGLVLPTLPDDVWENLSNVSEAKTIFSITKEDVSKMYKMNVIETGTTSQSTQRIGALTLKNGVVFSNPTNGVDSNDVWSHKIDAVEKIEDNREEWMFNIKNLSYFKHDNGKAFLKQSPNSENIKILVLDGEDSKMLIMLNKQV